MEKSKRNFLKILISGVGALSLGKLGLNISKSNTQTKFNIKEVLEKLKTNNLTPIKEIYSLNKDVPTIILIQDIDHPTTAENILKKIIKIREILEIEKLIVGLEGLSEKDLKENRSVIGNRILQDKLLELRNLFELIPIEDEDLQLEATKIDIAIDYHNYFILGRKTEKNKKILYASVVWAYNIWNEKAFEKAKEIYEVYRTQINRLQNPEDLLKGKNAIKRDFYAVNKFLDEIDNGIGIIVYGSYHTKNIINHLKNKLGNDFNLIII